MLSRLLSVLSLAAVACTPARVHGHASLLMPLPRNSIDNREAAWAGGKHPNTGWIEPYNCRCTNGTDLCDNGQSCFWFSQGCNIGCKVRVAFH